MYNATEVPAATLKAEVHRVRTDTGVTCPASTHLMRFDSLQYAEYLRPICFALWVAVHAAAALCHKGQSLRSARM